MKRLRPQSAAIPLVKSDHSINTSQQLLFHKKLSEKLVPPKEYFHDQESLYIQNHGLKQQINEIKYEYMKQKALISQLQKKITLIEKVDRYQLNVEPLGMSYQSEGSIVPMLKNKVKEQNEEIDELKNNLKRQFKSVKLTQLLEMEKEIKSYKDEIMKLQQLVQITLRISEQDLYNDPDISQRLQNFAIVVDAQENQISMLSQQNTRIKKEYQDILDEHQQLKEECKQLNFEKTQFKKQLEEQIITENEVYQQKKREFLEKKLQSSLKMIDTYKGELSLFESKYRNSQKQVKDIEKEFKTHQMDSQKHKQHLEETLFKREQLIQDLQERVQILDLLKQKNSPKPSDSPELPKMRPPPITYRDKDTQFPEQIKFGVKDEINTQPIDRNKLYLLLSELKFIIIRKKLTKERLLHLFGDKKYIQLKDSLKYFTQQPFNFNKENAMILCRYYIGEDCGTGFCIQNEDTQEIADLVKQMIEMAEENKLCFKTIVNWNGIVKVINQELQKCQLEEKCYDWDEYVIKLKNKTNLHDEQIELIQLVNYEYCGNFNHGFLKSFFKQECEMQYKLTKLTKMDIQYYQSKPTQKPKTDEDDDIFKFDMTKKQKNEPEYPPPPSPKQILEQQKQSIQNTGQVLTFSQIKNPDNLEIKNPDNLVIKNPDNDLKSSESRKPSDSFQYSTSNIQNKMPKQNDSINFNFEPENQYDVRSILQQSPIGEFNNNEINEINEPPLLKVRDKEQKNEHQHESQIVQIEESFEFEEID